MAQQLINLILTGGVYLFLALTWFTPGRLKTLGKRRRTIAIYLVMMGLCSIFVRIIIVEPAVLGRSHWSPFDILSQVHAGTLSFRGQRGTCLDESRCHLPDGDLFAFVRSSGRTFGLPLTEARSWIGGIRLTVSSIEGCGLELSIRRTQQESEISVLWLRNRTCKYSQGTILLVILIGVLATTYLGALDD